MYINDILLQMMMMMMTTAHWWLESRARSCKTACRGRVRAGSVPAATVTTAGWEKKDVTETYQHTEWLRGPGLCMPPTAKLKDFLDLYFDDAVWDLLVEMTN